MKTRHAYFKVGEKVISPFVDSSTLKSASDLARDISSSAEMGITHWQRGSPHYVERITFYDHTASRPFKYEGIQYHVVHDGGVSPDTSLAVAVNGQNAYLFYERSFRDQTSHLIEASIFGESVALFAQGKGYLPRFSLTAFYSHPGSLVFTLSVAAEFKKREFKAPARAVATIDQMISAYLNSRKLDREKCPKKRTRK